MITAVLFALFVWWFSTGAILWAVNRGAGRADVLRALPLALISLFAIHWAAHEGGVLAAYVGFGAAIVIWGWFEFAFLSGVLTGPNTKPCPPGLKGQRRFVMAWNTIAHHEIALLATITGISFLTHGGADQTGFWTFMVLFAARISAKLNVYLGVPNLSHEMLPGPVAHLKTYFATRRMNWLFPVSVTALTAATVHLTERVIAAGDAGTGFALIAALTALALLEHWLMVLPIREAALWRWMMRRRGDGDTGGVPSAK